MLTMPSSMHFFAALLFSVVVLSACTRLGPNFQQPAELRAKKWRVHDYRARQSATAQA